MTISGDTHVSSNTPGALPEPPRLPREATPEQAREYLAWMAGEGYDPARAQGMTDVEMANMSRKATPGTRTRPACRRSW